MKKSVKKIIAREGLIIVGFFIVYSLLASFPYVHLYIYNLSLKLRSHGSGYIQMLEPRQHHLDIAVVGITILGTTYVLYWLIRFIIWAIRTLGEK